MNRIDIATARKLLLEVISLGVDFRDLKAENTRLRMVLSIIANNGCGSKGDFGCAAIAREAIGTSVSTPERQP